MSSLPASQPAEDGEADGATAPPTVDPSSEEPPVTHGGVRKSVAAPPTGAADNDQAAPPSCHPPFHNVNLPVWERHVSPPLGNNMSV